MFNASHSHLVLNFLNHINVSGVGRTKRCSLFTWFMSNALNVTVALIELLQYKARSIIIRLNYENRIVFDWIYLDFVNRNSIHSPFWSSAIDTFWMTLHVAIDSTDFFIFLISIKAFLPKWGRTLCLGASLGSFRTKEITFGSLDEKVLFFFLRNRIIPQKKNLHIKNLKLTHQ